MGNYAASGGYYIASNCDKIFASELTVTGSIGVFGVKLDMTELASRYGIETDSVSLTDSNHSQAMSPFQRLTPEADAVIQRVIDNFYHNFKTVVSDGRKMSMEQVENISKGRIYTGSQAKEVGLVDALGGINDAIAYAQNKYTESKKANIEMWPKKTAWDNFIPTNISSSFDNESENDCVTVTNFDWLFQPNNSYVSKNINGFSGSLLVMSETEAVDVAWNDFMTSSRSK